MASKNVFKQGDRWVAQQDYYDHVTGKRKYWTRKCRTKELAKRAQADLVKKLREHEEASPNAHELTVREFVKYYEKNVLEWRDIDDSTKRKICDHIKNPILPSLEPPFDFTFPEFEEQVVRWFENFMNLKTLSGSSKLSRTTLHDGYASFAKMLDLAVHEKRISNNPLKNHPTVKCPTAELKNTERVITPDEFDNQLAPHLNNFRLEAAVLLAYTCGLRPGEIRGLKWDDIDIKNSEIYIQRSGPGTEKTKTGKPRRVPLQKRARLALKEWKKVQREEATKALGFNSANFVFTTPEGSPYSSRTFNQQRERFLIRNGLPEKFVWKSFRHGYATRLLADPRVPDIFVSRSLGHSSIKTTFDEYGHISPETRPNLDAVFR